MPTRAQTVMQTVLLGLATLLCLALPGLAWWYFEWGEALLVLAALLLVGGWWNSGSHERWTALVREIAARYVIGWVYFTVGLLALPVVVVAALGRLVSLLAVVPAGIFGAMAVEKQLVAAGVLAAAEPMASPAYWPIALAIGVVAALLVARWHRWLDDFDSNAAALAGARDGLTALLAARLGVRLVPERRPGR